MKDSVHREEYALAVIGYVLDHNPSRFTRETLPRDQSLIELEVLDSAAFVELVVFIESTWDIQIADEDFSKERMGSIERISSLISEYVGKRA